MIYGTEIIRGLDVFALTASEFLSDNEIAASNLAEQGGIFNPQQQFPVTWPAHPSVALAYVDQLERASNDSPGYSALREALEQALNRYGAGGTVVSDKPLAQRLSEMVPDLGSSQQVSALRLQVAAIADSLR